MFLNRWLGQNITIFLELIGNTELHSISWTYCEGKNALPFLELIAKTEYYNISWTDYKDRITQHFLKYDMDLYF